MTTCASDGGATIADLRRGLPASQACSMAMRVRVRVRLRLRLRVRLRLRLRLRLKAMNDLVQNEVL